MAALASWRHCGCLPKATIGEERATRTIVALLSVGVASGAQAQSVPGRPIRPRCPIYASSRSQIRATAGGQGSRDHRLKRTEQGPRHVGTAALRTGIQTSGFGRGANFRSWRKAAIRPCPDERPQRVGPGHWQPRRKRTSSAFERQCRVLGRGPKDRCWRLADLEEHSMSPSWRPGSACHRGRPPVSRRGS
jgi:hypothetical protein